MVKDSYKKRLRETLEEDSMLYNFYLWLEKIYVKKNENKNH
ncbi:hypothetical protein LCGC14_3034230 [marine sediment metagenome]|uniref:Uncharacterized protein n=1 Tax=marine sediment metagenome TaxID=412755 RepID=A0A0F8ZHL0_9ZZZZ